MPFLPPSQQRQSTEGKLFYLEVTDIMLYFCCLYYKRMHDADLLLQIETAGGRYRHHSNWKHLSTISASLMPQHLKNLECK